MKAHKKDYRRWEAPDADEYNEALKDLRHNQLWTGELRRRLDDFFNAGRSGMNWYEFTKDKLGSVLGYDIGDKLIGCLAVTSANTTVAGNVTLALKALGQWLNEEEFTGYLPNVIENLEALKENDPLKGDKINNFYQALMGNHDAIVIDRWILRAFNFKNSTPKRRQFIRNVILLESIKHGVSPRQYQAAIWFGVKENEDFWNRADDPFEVHLLARLHELGEYINHEEGEETENERV
jgi:hypothetical protein